jgi:formylglycine-generating enzyme required for sulfatase activity
MARLFISYSRTEEAFARRLAEELSIHGADVWIDVEDIPAGMKWSSAIQQGLDNAELMIVIISPDSMASRNVEDEWQYYLDHAKPIIPILFQPAKIHFQLSRIQYIDFYALDFDTAFRRLHAELARKGVPLDPMEGTEYPPAMPHAPAQVATRETERREPEPPPQPEQQPAPSPTLKMPTARPQSQPGQAAPLSPPRPITQNLPQRLPLMMGAVGVMVAVGIISVVIFSSSGNGNNGGQDDLPTDAVDPPTDTPVQAVVTPPYQQPIAHNWDWEPWTQTFGGVEMMLVPPGCYTMGSSPQHIQDTFRECSAILGENTCNLFEDEGPQREYCYTEPFWIDRYQVTNQQYGSHGTFTGANEPRTNITWWEAYQHCERRGGRLPTEAEWEYAARGPDNLIYPWGDEFDGTNLNFCDSNCQFNWRDPNWNDGYAQVSPVGAYPDGESWVGALDMAGNTWEWTSTIYRPYPYQSHDGRENLDDRDSRRTLRGGTWNYLRFETRTSARAANLADFPSSDWYGFRCTRDFNPADIVPVPAN